MRQVSTYDKEKARRRITPPVIFDRLRNWLYPQLMLLPKAKVKYRLEMQNHWEAIPGHSIIFASNHSAFPDIPIALKAVGRHSYVLIGKQNLAFLDEIFFGLNGVIWVDRKKREDMAASKRGVQAYLVKGYSVLWFPEATWNLTDNLLMLPMKWGIIDAAQKADAQIIPMVLDYDREKMVCRVRFGRPMAGDTLLDKSTAIRNLRDALATMRWDMMQNQPILRRCDAVPEVLRKDMIRVLDEYPPLDWEYEQSCIYQYPAEDVFAHLHRLVPRRENAFLFNNRLGR